MPEHRVRPPQVHQVHGPPQDLLQAGSGLPEFPGIRGETSRGQEQPQVHVAALPLGPRGGGTEEIDPLEIREGPEELLLQPVPIPIRDRGHRLPASSSSKAQESSVT